MTRVQASWAQLTLPEPQPMDRGCPPGSLWFTFPNAPALGAPYRCAFGTPNALPTPPRPGPATSRPYRLRTGLCNPLADPFTPSGAFPDYGSTVLVQLTRMLARWQAYVQPFVPGARGGPAELNPANGNLLLRLVPPAAGAFDPSAILFYNSQCPQSSEFGYGWSLVPKQTLSSLTAATVNVDGTGTSLRYRWRDPNSNYYLGPGGGNDSLLLNGDQTWTQTQADGFQVHYDAGGRANYLATPSGDRWTLSYQGGTPWLLQFVADPFAPG